MFISLSLTYAKVERQTAATNTFHFLCSVWLHNVWKSGIWKKKKREKKAPFGVRMVAKFLVMHAITTNMRWAPLTQCPFHFALIKFHSHSEDVPTITYAMELVHGFDVMEM